MPMRALQPLAFALALTFGVLPALATAAPANADEGMDVPDEPVAPPLPRSPLEGTFQLVRTVPEIGMNEKRYETNFFFPGQKIHFKYVEDMGHGDGMWEGQQAYVMTLYPPFPLAMCRHLEWYYLCKNNDTYIPHKEERRELMLITGKLQEEEIQELSPLLKPLGLGLGTQSYGLSFADKTGYYDLYFPDRNTMVHRVYHRLYEADPEKPRIIDVIQVFKRVAPEPPHVGLPASVSITDRKEQR